MKIINLTLIALTFIFGPLHHSIQAMENPKSITEKKKYKPKNSKQRKELNVQTKAIIRVQKIDGARWQKMQSYALNTGILIPSKKQKLPLIGQKKSVVEDALQQVIIQPIEKEVTNSIPPVQIEKRSELLENSEIATIQNLADLIENRLNDSIPEVKVENCSVLTENAAALPTSQLAESNSSLSDSQLEDFPIPVNLINQATSNASNNAIVTDKLGVNDDASSTINSNNSEDEARNQLTEKRNKQIVKIAPLLIQKFNEDNAQPISVQKELTQEEIIARAHAMATTLEQSVDIFLIDVYDKYKSSIKTFKETTKEERQLFGTKSFFSSKAAPNDKFEIKDFIDKHRVDLLLCNQIKNCGLRITDPVEKMKLKNRLGIIANKSSYNCRLMETLLNSFIQKKQHQTATIISYDINMNKEESGQLFFDKIAPIIKKGNSDLRTGYWTSTKNCPQAQERSNNDFALENSIAFPQAEKYLLDQLPEHIKKTQATLATALTNAKIGF